MNADYITVNTDFIGLCLNTENMKIPQFLYVPRINTISDQKMIIETRKGIYFLIYDFESQDELISWLNQNNEMLESDFELIYEHPKYPFLIATLKPKNSVDDSRLNKLSKMAADWYVQFRKNQ